VIPALDLSPAELTSDELKEIREFVEESYSPWRSSQELSYLIQLLRHADWLEDQI
jgi:hypothetical protein